MFRDELCTSFYFCLLMAIAYPARKRQPMMPCVLDIVPRRFVYWISSIERDWDHDNHLLHCKATRKNSNERSTESHWSSNEIEDCLLTPKKRKCKPFARRVSKHRHCTNARSGGACADLKTNGIHLSEIFTRRANPATPATLRDHSSASFREHERRPGLRGSK